VPTARRLLTADAANVLFSMKQRDVFVVLVVAV
jgi:hypothetical protein